MWLENQHMWHMVLSCTSCFIFLNFWGIFEPFMSFYDPTRFIFEFLLKLAHMSLLKVFMQYLRFLDFYMTNDPKLELELRNLENFWAGWNLVLRTVRGYGADSPPFMELVHQRLSGVVVNCKNTLRTVRQRTADGPPEAVLVGLQCKDSKADGPLGYRGQSANGQKGGSWQLDLSSATKVYL